MKKIDPKKGLLIFLLLSLFAFRLWQSTGCLGVRDFKFNPSSVTTAVETQRQSDGGEPEIISKVLHNKVTVAPSQFLQNLSISLTPRFLLDLVSPIVLASALIAAFQVIKNKNKTGIIFLGALLLFQVVSTLFISSKTAILILCAFWFLLTFWSLDFYIKKRWRYIGFLALWLYSLWFFFISWQLPQICNEIIFK